MTSVSGGQAQYLAFSDGLKQLPGRAFEEHGHPAVLLDRVSGPSIRVWGWWTDGSPALPCLLWCGESGWSATVVEPDALDSEGYEREFWAHRIKLLDLALANALGPYRTLEDLELHVSAAASFGLGNDDIEIRTAMRWGILHLRAARARLGGDRHWKAHARALAAPGGGVVDAELARYSLIPTLPKPRGTLAYKRKDLSVNAVLEVFSTRRQGDRMGANK